MILRDRALGHLFDFGRSTPILLHHRIVRTVLATILNATDPEVAGIPRSGALAQFRKAFSDQLQIRIRWSAALANRIRIAMPEGAHVVLRTQAFRACSRAAPANRTFACHPARVNIFPAKRQVSCYRIGARGRVFGAMSSSGAVTLGDIADKIMMLEISCSRCGRYGRLRGCPAD